ncbi:hypothetical protein BD413DRAFT_243498 [Trametes elegans]|nr:hypothetical protein BD413DRAFT_243498 [Trametes elegans]
MALFAGQAWFSPQVPLAARKAWVANGGTVSSGRTDGTRTTYVFCNGSKDPWFPKLYQRSMAVFHWLWISAVVTARFRVPISTYVIDDARRNIGEKSAPAYTRPSPYVTDTKPVPERDEARPRKARSAICAPDRSSMGGIAMSSSENGCDDECRSTCSAGSIGKSKAMPFVNLRRTHTSNKVAKITRLQVVRIASSKTERVRAVRALTPKQYDGAQPLNSFLTCAAGSVSPTRAISVSAALEALSSVSIEKATQFVPGAVHLGKEFRCFYSQ